jgi:hypothetical protein
MCCFIQIGKNNFDKRMILKFGKNTLDKRMILKF